MYKVPGGGYNCRYCNRFHPDVASVQSPELIELHASLSLSRSFYFLSFLVIFFRNVSLTLSTGVLKRLSIMAAADEPKMAPGQSRREATKMWRAALLRCSSLSFVLLDSRTQ